MNDPCRGFTGGIGHLQWVLGVGVRGWRDRDEDVGGWNRRSRCKILHFVVWEVEGQDEIPRRRPQRSFENKTHDAGVLVSCR